MDAYRRKLFLPFSSTQEEKKLATGANGIISVDEGIADFEKFVKEQGGTDGLVKLITQNEGLYERLGTKNEITLTNAINEVLNIKIGRRHFLSMFTLFMRLLGLPNLLKPRNQLAFYKDPIPNISNAVYLDIANRLLLGFTYEPNTLDESAINKLLQERETNDNVRKVLATFKSLSEGNRGIGDNEKRNNRKLILSLLQTMDSFRSQFDTEVIKKSICDNPSLGPSFTPIIFNFLLNTESKSNILFMQYDQEYLGHLILGFFSGSISPSTLYFDQELKLEIIKLLRKNKNKVIEYFEKYIEGILKLKSNIGKHEIVLGFISCHYGPEINNIEAIIGNLEMLCGYEITPIRKNIGLVTWFKDINKKIFSINDSISLCKKSKSKKKLLEIIGEMKKENITFKDLNMNEDSIKDLFGNSFTDKYGIIWYPMVDNNNLWESEVLGESGARIWMTENEYNFISFTQNNHNFSTSK